MYWPNDPEDTRLFKDLDDGEVLAQTVGSVQWGYQTFQYTLTFRKRNNPVRITGQLRYDHTRAADWTNARILVDDSTPWLPYVDSQEVTISHTTSNDIPLDLSMPRMIHTMRGKVLDATYRVSYDTYTSYNLRSYLESDGHAAMDNGERWSYYYREREEATMNTMLSTFPDSVNRIIEKLTCPDEIEGCSGKHLDTVEHQEDYLGVLSPLGELNEVTFMNTSYMVESVWVRRADFESTWGGFDWNAVRATLGQFTCLGCGEAHTNDNAHRSDTDWCEDCFYNSEECDGCSRRVGESDVYEREDYDEMSEEFTLVTLCYECYHSGGSAQLALHDYSFKPDPIFHKLPTESDDVLFMGMELEVARTGQGDNQTLNRWINKASGDFLYMKSDSSVQHGMEVVTHPFTYDWAKENFPMSDFEALLKFPSILPRHDTAGTHVHLSKSAFTNAHMWKFILFFLENADFVGLMGGRGASASYGPLKGPTMDALRKDLTRVAKGQPGTGNYGRSGINIYPPNTIEMRFMAGDVSPEGIKKNMQLMKSAYDFTAEVKARDALKGALKDPGYFLGYLEDFDYPELVTFLEKALPKPKKLERIN